MVKRKSGRTPGKPCPRYESPFDGQPPRYDGPTFIGKPIKPAPFGVGPQWVGKRAEVPNGQADQR